MSAENSRPWFLYILRCRDGSLYTGITVNVEQRFQKHIAGEGARYTRSHPPECILAVLSYADQASATRAEYAIKKLSVEKKLALCREYAYDKEQAGVDGFLSH